MKKKFFRQINSLVIYLVNALLSRNFCQKSVRGNSHNSQCGKYGILLSRFFGKNFVKATHLQCLTTNHANYSSNCRLTVLPSFRSTFLRDGLTDFKSVNATWELRVSAMLSNFVLSLGLIMAY